MSERGELPVLGQTDVPLTMDRRQALKVMAIAAASPGLTSCTPTDDSGAAAIQYAVNSTGAG